MKKLILVLLCSAMIFISSVTSIEAMITEQLNSSSEVTLEEIQPNAGNPSIIPSVNRQYNQMSDEEYNALISKLHEEDGDNSRAIIGEDNRIQILDSSDHDFTTVARIISTYPNGHVSACSSTLVSANMVLTNAHCVYNSERGGLATSVSVTPGQIGNDDQGRPFGTALSKRIMVPDRWVETQNRNYDYAVIELEQPIGNITGWKGITTDVTANEITQSRFFMSGYPGDKPRGTMWMDSGDLWFEGKNNYLYHNLSTNPGSSGSGIYRTFSNKPSDLSYVIAVHASGLVSGRANVAINLTNTSNTNPGYEVINWITGNKYSLEQD